MKLPPISSKNFIVPIHIIDTNFYPGFLDGFCTITSIGRNSIHILYVNWKLGMESDRMDLIFLIIVALSLVTRPKFLAPLSLSVHRGTHYIQTRDTMLVNQTTLKTLTGMELIGSGAFIKKISNQTLYVGIVCSS